MPKLTKIPSRFGAHYKPRTPRPHSANARLEALEPRQLYSAAAIHNALMLAADTVVGGTGRDVIMSPSTAPAAPTLASSSVSISQINLTWNAVTGASAYKVETSLNSGSTWSTLTTTAATFYNSYGLSADTAYEYRVTTIAPAGNSVPSNVVSPKTLTNPPTGFTATTQTATHIALTWNVVTDATTYKIERSIDGNTWSTLTISPALTSSSTSYTDTTALAGTLYFYRISATATAGTSIPSGIVSATTLPAAPVVTGVPISKNEIDLSWPAIPSAFNYLIERSVNAGTNWMTLTTQGGLTYPDTGLTPDKSYEYRVTAISGAGSSALSNIVTKSTFLDAPTAFDAATDSTTEIDLTWAPVTDATTYLLQRSLDGTNFSTVTPGTAFNSTSASFANTGLTAGTLYYYRLSAINAVGTSVASSVASSKTLPLAPTVSASVVSASSLAVSWSAILSATGYKVEESTNLGTTWNVMAASQSATTFATGSLNPDTKYEFRVSTLNSAGVSAISNVVTPTTTLAAPQSFTSAATSATAVHLAWTEIPDATSYKLERSLDGTNFSVQTQSPTIAGTAAVYNDNTASAGVVYYYRLSAINTNGTSVASPVTHSLADPAAPVATATVNSSSQITVSWAAVTAATSYKVEGSNNGGSSWSLLGTPAAGTLTLVNSSLQPDSQYKYRITANDASGPSAISNIATASTLLLPPTNLGAMPTNATTIHLVWTPVIDATSYKILRSTGNTTSFAAITTSGITGSTASYNDTTAAAGTAYYYEIEAVDAAGTSVASGNVEAITVPAAPTLSNATPTATAITLNWTASTNATSYLLQVSADGGTTWTNVATPSAPTVTAPSSGLTPGASYKYRVYAVNAGGQSVVSNILSLTTIPAAPTNFAATPATATSVSLTWTAVTGATTYKLERSPDGTTWATLNPSPALTGTSATYTDATVLGGTTYHYRISTTNATGTSATATPVVILTVPAAPVVTATVNTASQITISWAAVTGATGYTLLGSNDGGTNYTILATQSTLTYVHTPHAPDTQWKYRVLATDATGNSASSNLPTATTLLGPPRLFALTVNSATNITLSWMAETDATTYKLERSLDGTTFTTLTPATALTGSSASYADTTVLAGTKYYYRISAKDAAGLFTATTAVLNATTLPVAPSLTAALISATQVNLTWSAATGATSYKLEDSTDGGSTWLPAVSTGTVSFVDNMLTADTAYKFRVSALDITGASAFSNIPAVTTYLPTPPAFAGAVTTGTNVNLTWTAVTDATNYKIERSPDGTLWTALVPGTAFSQSTNSYSDSSVSAGTQYYYRISAQNTVGFSAVSSVVPELTLPATPTLSDTLASPTEIDLSWTAVKSATSYKVETSVDSGTTWTTLATPVTLFYANTGLTSTNSYEYRVSGTNATGNSTASAVVTATAPLASPIGFSASVISASEIDLAWTAESSAVGYKVERSTDSATWTTLAAASTLTGTDHALADTTVSGGTKYFYRLSGIDGNTVSSLPTATVSGLTEAPATTLTAVPVSATSIALTWPASKSATSYTIESVVSGTATALMTQPTGAVTSFTVTGLTADSPYSYDIIANNATGAGAESAATAAVTTKLAAPANFNVSGHTPTSTDLTWNSITDATSYLLERSPDGITYTTVTQSPTIAGTDVSYVDSGLTSGTKYYYRLTAIDASGSSAPTVASGYTEPANTTLSAVATGTSSIALTWTAVPSATTYTIFDIVNGTVTQDPTQPGALVTSFTYTGLTVDTPYSYAVFVTGPGGNSTGSNEVTPSTLLAAPSTLTAVPTSTGATLTFNQTTDATGYIVQRSTDNTLFSLVGNTLTGTSTSFVDSGLNPGTTYYYKLEAVDAAGTSAPATVSTLTTPNSPTLGGIATSTSQITLAWNPVFGATSYTLDMVVSGTATALASQPVGTATSLTISTGLSADSPYTYEIFASDASGASAASSTVTITTPLAAPTFTPTVSAGGVTLTFSAVADATSFLVQRSNDNVIFSPITNTLTGTSTAFVDSTALPGHSYYYSLTAIDAAGSSAAAVSNVLTLPDVPTLGAISTNGTSVFLSWNGVASATGYTLEMVVSGTATALSSQPIGAVTSFLVTGLTADSPYTYDIIATNSSGSSAESPTVNVTTLLAPPVITVAATTATSNTINWTSIPDATSYLLERSTNQAVWSVVTPAPAAGVATYVDNTNVVGGKTYYYRLSAIDAAGNSGPSNVASVLTYPTAPGVTAVVYSASEIDLTWTPSKSATAYVVNVETGTVWAANTTQPSGTATTLDLTGLTADTSYTYQVLAVNTTGTGAASNTVTPTTILAPPTGFSATEASDTSVTLAWTAVTDATNYIVQSSPDSNTWTTATGTSFTQSSNSYAVTGLTPGTVYYYRIASFNTLGQSVYTSPANATTPLNAPVGLTAAVNSASQISLTWTLDTDTGLTGYRLESSPDGNAWGTLAILGPISTSAIDTGLTTGTTYHFRLFALSTGGDSAADGPIVATTS